MEDPKLPKEIRQKIKSILIESTQNSSYYIQYGGGDSIYDYKYLYDLWRLTVACKKVKYSRIVSYVDNVIQRDLYQKLELIKCIELNKVFLNYLDMSYLDKHHPEEFNIEIVFGFDEDKYKYQNQKLIKNKYRFISKG